MEENALGYPTIIDEISFISPEELDRSFYEILGSKEQIAYREKIRADIDGLSVLGSLPKELQISTEFIKQQYAEILDKPNSESGYMTLGYFLRNGLRDIHKILTKSLEELNSRLRDFLFRSLEISPWMILILADNLGSIFEFKKQSADDPERKLHRFGSPESHRQMVLTCSILFELYPELDRYSCQEWLKDHAKSVGQIREEFFTHVVPVKTNVSTFLWPVSTDHCAKAIDFFIRAVGYVRRVNDVLPVISCILQNKKNAGVKLLSFFHTMVGGRLIGDSSRVSQITLPKVKIIEKTKRAINARDGKMLASTQFN